MATRDEAAANSARDLLTLVNARISEYRTIAATIAEASTFVSGLLAGLGVQHRWVGSRLDIMGKDGAYIEGPDLQGNKGDRGDKGERGPAIELRRWGAVIEWAVAGATPSTWSTLMQVEDLKGDKGDIGLTPTLSVGAVMTLEPHQEASATIDGSDQYPVLHLSLPKGDPGDAYETYSAVIYRPAGVALGTYYLERSASADSVQARLFAEVVAGSAGATVTCHLTVNDVAVTGALTATLGTPVLQTGLTIDIDPGDRINLVITSVSGATEFYFKTYGAVA